MTMGQNTSKTVTLALSALNGLRRPFSLLEKGAGLAGVLFPSCLIPACAWAMPFVYVATHSGVSVIDVHSSTVVKTMALDGGPVDAALAPNEARLYVANWNTDTVSIIDTETNNVMHTVRVGDKPRRVAVAPDGSHVYALNQEAGSLSVIKTSSGTVVDTVLVKAHPETVIPSPDGRHVYVTNTGSDNISIIDTSTNTQTDTVRVGDGPFGAAVSPDGNRIYVSNSNSDNVSIIDTRTNKVTDTVSVGDTPAGLAFTYNGLYVANFKDGTVSVIDVETNKRAHTVRVGEKPNNVAISPDGGRAYVQTDTDTVSVIDTVTNTVIERVPLGKSVYGMAVSPVRQPPELYVDRDACPYEYCVYDEWCTLAGTVALAGPTEDAPLIGVFKKGLEVEAVTGKVVSRPGKLTVIKPHGRYEPGDVLWVYTYLGESVSKIWFEGTMYEEQLYSVGDSGEVAEAEVEKCMRSQHCWGRSDQRPESTWWVAIRAGENWGGWTNRSENFGRTALMDEPCGK